MRRVHALILSLLLLSLSACALFPNRDPVNINVVGLEPLPSQDLEVRFAIKIRVQNPNETAIDYNGIALDLEVNGHSLASGVSDEALEINAYGKSQSTADDSDGFALERRVRLTLQMESGAAVARVNQNE